MSNFIGNSNIIKGYIGSTEVKKIYFGNKEIYSGGNQFYLDFNSLDGWTHEHTGSTTYSQVLVSEYVTNFNKGCIKIQADTNLQNWIYKTFDFSGINKIKLVFQLFGNTDAQAYGRVLIGGVQKFEQKAGTISGAQEVVIDVSDITGPQELRFVATKDQNWGAATWFHISTLTSI